MAAAAFEISPIEPRPRQRPDGNASSNHNTKANGSGDSVAGRSCSRSHRRASSAPRQLFSFDAEGEATPLPNNFDFGGGGGGGGGSSSEEQIPSSHAQIAGSSERGGRSRAPLRQRRPTSSESRLPMRPNSTLLTPTQSMLGKYSTSRPATEIEAEAVEADAIAGRMSGHPGWPGVGLGTSSPPGVTRKTPARSRQDCDHKIAATLAIQTSATVPTNSPARHPRTPQPIHQPAWVSSPRQIAPLANRSHLQEHEKREKRVNSTSKLTDKRRRSRSAPRERHQSCRQQHASQLQSHCSATAFTPPKYHSSFGASSAAVAVISDDADTVAARARQRRQDERHKEGMQVYTHINVVMRHANVVLCVDFSFCVTVQYGRVRAVPPHIMIEFALVSCRVLAQAVLSRMQLSRSFSFGTN